VPQGLGVGHDSARAAAWLQAAAANRFALAAFTLGLLLESGDLELRDVAVEGPELAPKQQHHNQLQPSAVPPGAEATAAAAHW
jgi:TPR repeat protein